MSNSWSGVTLIHEQFSELREPSVLPVRVLEVRRKPPEDVVAILNDSNREHLLVENKCRQSRHDRFGCHQTRDARHHNCGGSEDVAGNAKTSGQLVLGLDVAIPGLSFKSGQSPCTVNKLIAVIIKNGSSVLVSNLDLRTIISVFLRDIDHQSDEMRRKMICLIRKCPRKWL